MATSADTANSSCKSAIRIDTQVDTVRHRSFRVFNKKFEVAHKKNPAYDEAGRAHFNRERPIMTKKRPKAKKLVRPPRRVTPTSAVITALGGTHKVAALLGVSPTAVSNYNSFGLFPAATFFVLRDELKARGIRANERLWNMKQRAA